jgi:hypothetical protein
VKTESWATLPEIAEIFARLNQPMPMPTRVRGGESRHSRRPNRGWVLTEKAYRLLGKRGG